MTDIYLDPEMESEARALACYEDELRQLRAQAIAQDEDLRAHAEEYAEGQAHVDEVVANEEANKSGQLVYFFTLDMFRKGGTHMSLDENGEDDGFSIIDSLEYGSAGTPFHVSMNEYSGGGISVFVHLKSGICDIDLSRHFCKSFNEGCIFLNDMMLLVRQLVEDEIHD